MIGPDIRCATCAFFHQYQRPGFVIPTMRGFCRRHAPALYQDEAHQLRAAWPMVHEDAFCGEHATIEPDEPPAQEEKPTEPTLIIERRGPEWRCVNCKFTELSDREPARCSACRCQTLELVES